MKRNRILYAGLILGTIGVGLASRMYSKHLPEFINLGLGDALWALMIYWIIGFVFIRTSIVNVAIVSLTICFLVELSQLIKVDWLDAIRNTTLGALILGKGFLWSDLLAYSIGVSSGLALEMFTRKPTAARTQVD